MREIKFRACFKDVLKQEYKWFYATVAEKPTIPINYGQHTEWEQFTGLQDSNGVDVYGGDFIRWDYNRLHKRKFIALVVEEPQFEIFRDDFDVPHFSHGFALQFLDGSGYSDLHKPNFIVVGNIHEHAHLLEGKDD